MDFSKTTLWIQVHGLPSLWLSEANLRSIGTMAGEVLELDLAGEGGSEWRRFTRIKTDIDVAQPLLLGVFLPRPNLDDLWVSLKYEKLSIICYTCGLIGHDERIATKKPSNYRTPLVPSLWLLVLGSGLKMTTYRSVYTTKGTCKISMPLGMRLLRRRWYLTHQYNSLSNAAMICPKCASPKDRR